MICLRLFVFAILWFNCEQNKQHALHITFDFVIFMEMFNILKFVT